MKVETFDEKLMWIRRIKRMILSYKQDLDKLEKRKKETFWKHFDAFTGPYPNLLKARELGEEYDMIIEEIAYVTEELTRWRELYFRDLKNL